MACTAKVILINPLHTLLCIHLSPSCNKIVKYNYVGGPFLSALHVYPLTCPGPIQINQLFSMPTKLCRGMTTLTSVVHSKACALYFFQITYCEQQIICHVGDRHNILSAQICDQHNDLSGCLKLVTQFQNSNCVWEHFLSCNREVMATLTQKNCNIIQTKMLLTHKISCFDSLF